MFINSYDQRTEKGRGVKISPERKKYIGFIIDSALPSLSNCLKLKCSPRVLLSGWPQTSSIARMRFQWIADCVNKTNSCGLCYELYRPWRKYSVVIFLKSMGMDCLSLVKFLKKNGTASIFDLNVDYLTPATGKIYYATMAPTEDQRQAATTMASVCDAVIADSRHLSRIASTYNTNTGWIPDNVRSDLIVQHSKWRRDNKKTLSLLWSGESVKLYDLLLIRDVLIEYADFLHLKIITNSLQALSNWHKTLRNDFYSMLDQISHEITPFVSIEKLMEEYNKGGIFISPRFLDNSYNLGHTEWKITLPMAKGRVVLCSDQQSYIDVHERCNGKGIRICANEEEWRGAFDEVLSNNFFWEEEQQAAIGVVREWYSTPVVSTQHVDFLKDMICG